MRDRACRTAHRAIVRLSATMDRTKTNAFAVVGGIALGSDSLARSFHGTRRGRRPGDEANTRPETSRLWVRLCRLRPATPHTAACRHQRSDCIDLSRRITYMPICALSVSTTVRVQLYMIVCNGRDRVRYSCTLQLYPDPDSCNNRTYISSYSYTAAELGGVGSVFDRYQGAPRLCLALDIDSRFTGDWQTILEP